MPSPALYDAGVDPHDEMVERRQAPDPNADDPWVQMNVRVRKSMLARVDARRKKLEMSRDDWTRHVFEWALLQPPMTAVRPRNGRQR